MLAQKTKGKAKTKPKFKPSAESVAAVFKTLGRLYPSAETELTYESPFQLLIAVILSAQCTDDRVNKTTPQLFQKYPSAKELAKAKQADVEKIIHSCGFFRAKSKAIIKTSQDLQERFSGEIPRTLEELTTLSGVGRKTASVVLNQAFDLPAIAVDTHVNRVANRLGWTFSPDPFKIEMDLRELVPMPWWGDINTLLILHGRRICKARKPLCEECPIIEECAFGRVLKGKPKA